jgi:hypothetical protein
MNFATAMASGQIDGVALDTTRLPIRMRPLATALIGFEPSAPTVNALDGVHKSADTGRDRVAVVLASPDFQKR